MRSPAPADMAPPCPCQHCGLSGTRDRRGDPACRMSLMSSSMSEGLCEYSFQGSSQRCTQDFTINLPPLGCSHSSSYRLPCLFRLCFPPQRLLGLRYYQLFPHLGIFVSQARMTAA